MSGKTRIIATIGAIDGNGSRDVLHKLMVAGMDVARINFAHAKYEEVEKQIKWIREISSELRQKTIIYADLAGPKIRLGSLKKSIKVRKGDELGLMYGAKHKNEILPVSYDFSGYVSPKQRIFLFDGKIEAEIVAVVGKIVKIISKTDGYLTSHNGINLPDTSFVGDPLTSKDLADLEFIYKNDFDWVGLSFVHSAKEVKVLRQLVKNKLKVISKIETKSATELRTMAEIIKVSDGVMAARGDMAYEVGPELVPIIQWRMVKMAKAAKKKSIIATQMMASMVDVDKPTRAEVSDVARAVFEGADYTMLSEETAMGSYPVEAVTEMARIIKVIQKNMIQGSK